jgi:hypothetical protein
LQDIKGKDKAELEEPDPEPEEKTTKELLPFYEPIKFCKPSILSGCKMILLGNRDPAFILLALSPNLYRFIGSTGATFLLPESRSITI